MRLGDNSSDTGACFTDSGEAEAGSRCAPVRDDASHRDGRCPSASKVEGQPETELYRLVKEQGAKLPRANARTVGILR